MNNNDLIKVSDSLLNFLWILHTNILKGNDIAKNLPYSVKELNQYTDDIQIPPSHIKVIFHLSLSGPSSISQVAKALNISKSNMTPIIDKLISYEFVNRYADPNDRRILRVELTPKAVELLQSIRSATCKLLVEKISKLSDGEIITLDQSISNLTILLNKLH